MTPVRTTRDARIIAADVRRGDWLAIGDSWHMVGHRYMYGSMVELDIGLVAPVAFERNEPVLVRWQVPGTTVGLAQDIRR